MIVAGGEALIDLVPVRVGDEVAYLPRAGGCSYNVAIGTARLGAPTAYLGRISRDRFGRLLRERLEANGVDLRYLSLGDEPTTLAVVHLEAGREPRFAFYGEGTADRLLHLVDVPTIGDDVAAMHFGSISLTREPGASTYEALIRREHGRRVIVLDPNVRPALIPDRAAYVARLEGWVALCDLVKVSRADLGWLYPGLEPIAAARRWRELGPAVVVVTNGEAGATGLSAAARVEVPGVEVAVADTVGAGDAFTAGLLAWLDEHGRLDRRSLERLEEAELVAGLRFATRVAALTCARAGAEPPTREELGATTEGGQDG
jgi:fructokinase